MCSAESTVMSKHGEQPTCSTDKTRDHWIWADAIAGSPPKSRKASRLIACRTSCRSDRYRPDAEWVDIPLLNRGGIRSWFGQDLCADNASPTASADRALGPT